MPIVNACLSCILLKDNHKHKFISMGVLNMKRFVKLAGVLLAAVSITVCTSTSPSSPAPKGATGSATATAEGYTGDITVTLTMENGVITAVTADGPDETPGIGARAVMLLPAEIVKKGSPDVDILSGATFSSEGVITAAKEAIEKINAANPQ
jgi:fumarate reductase flavoprotein subunit